MDKRAGRTVAHAGSHARFRRHPAKGSHDASPRLSACPRSAEAKVHLSGCAQHSGSAPFGNSAGATWPGCAPLLRTIFYSSSSPPTIPLSLYNSHPRALPPLSSPNPGYRSSRAAARSRSPPGTSPPRLSLLLDFTDLACFTVPSYGGSGSRHLPASTAHAMHGRSIPSDRDCRRHAVASPLASPLSHPLASFCVVSGFDTACLSRSYSF